MGLMNLGATFQRVMDKILANMDNVKCYIDDVVIHSRTREEHITRLRTVFELLRKNGFASVSRTVSSCNQELSCSDISLMLMAYIRIMSESTRFATRYRRKIGKGFDPSWV